jgi:hypothetical protein
VDDILAINDEMEAKRLKEQLVARCGSVQFEANGTLLYLGMDVKITDEGTRVDMSFYVKQLVKDTEMMRTLATYESLGTKELFVVNKEGESWTTRGLDGGKLAVYSDSGNILMYSREYNMLLWWTAKKKKKLKLLRLMGYLKATTADRTLMMGVHPLLQGMRRSSACGHNVCPARSIKETEVHE